MEAGLDPHLPNRLTRAQIRRIRRGLLALLVLAWATHLLVTQWASGASGLPAGNQADEPTTLVLHLRASADATGAEITLSDVAFIEWRGTPIHGIVDLPIAAVAEISGTAEASDAGAQVAVGIEQIITALEAAGVDADRIQVHGPVRCKVRLLKEQKGPPSIASDEAALLSWAKAASNPNNGSPEEPQAAAPALPPEEPISPPVSEQPSPGLIPASSRNLPAPPRRTDREFIGKHGTVGEALRRDLAARLSLPSDNIHLRFAGEDMALVQRSGISESDVRALSAGDLGDVAWTVNIDGREIPVMAHASASVVRAVAVQGVNAGQIVRAGDVIGKQAHIERLADRGVAPARAAGQQAAVVLQAGQVLRDEDLKPRLLVQAGQLISVEENRSGTAIRLLAKALDDGWHGQIVRARREGSEQVVHVLVTSPQAGRVVDAPAQGASAAGTGDAIPGQ